MVEKDIQREAGYESGIGRLQILSLPDHVGYNATPGMDEVMNDHQNHRSSHQTHKYVVLGSTYIKIKWKIIWKELRTSKGAAE